MIKHGTKTQGEVILQIHTCLGKCIHAVLGQRCKSAFQQAPFPVRSRKLFTAFPTSPIFPARPRATSSSLNGPTLMGYLA